MKRTLRAISIMTLAMEVGCGSSTSHTPATDASPTVDSAADASRGELDAAADAAPTVDAAVDASEATSGNRHISADDPALAGLFLLGPDDYEAHVAKIGAAPALVHLFVDWLDGEALAALNADPTAKVAPRPMDGINLEILKYAFREKTIVAISWALPLPVLDVPATAYPQVPTVQRLVSGEYDDYVRAFAKKVKALDFPVLLNLFGEFDNHAFYSFGAEGLEAAALDKDLAPELQPPVASDLEGHYGDPEQPDGPERVRDAFIRVIDIFRAEGVDVSWFMYASSGFVVGKPAPHEDLWWNRPEFYYPGDDYIDWVGKSLHHQGLADLKNRFEAAYKAWGAVTKRPFFAPEFSINEGVGEKSRAGLIRQELTGYLPSFARLKAVANADNDPASGDTSWGLFTLGGAKGEYPDEVTAYKEAVVTNPAWAVLPAE